MEGIKLSYSSLEPYIDTETFYLHFHKHYLKYVENLNKIFVDLNDKGDENLVSLIKNIEKFNLNIRGDIIYNIGGILNHELYFKNISPNGSTYPSGLLKKAIDDKYQNYNSFVREFIKQTNKLVGSGFTFLVLKDGELDIVNMSNVESPYLYGMTPLMTIDLWEHAYYLKYQNNREQYVKNFFSIINYKEVERIYEEEIKANK